MITASQRLYIRPESDHKPLPFPSRPLGPETSSHPRKHHDSPHASVAHPRRLSSPLLPVRVRYSVFLSASLALPTRAHRFAGHTSNYTQLKPSQHRVSHPSAFSSAG